MFFLKLSETVQCIVKFSDSVIYSDIARIIGLCIIISANIDNYGSGRTNDNSTRLLSLCAAAQPIRSWILV